MPDADADAVVRELRDRITENDHLLLEAVNRRLELVARLKAHKEAAGLSFLDRGRERRIMEELLAANTGPLSSEGLRSLFAAVLELTKRELEEGDGAAERGSA
ncbi:MAG: chorismate mutase [Gaiellaceae bacterium]